jgi:hypothetical protein
LVWNIVVSLIPICLAAMFVMNSNWELDEFYKITGRDASLLQKRILVLLLPFSGREGCQGGPPILACAWATVSGTSRVNESTSMLHTEVGSSVYFVALLHTRKSFNICISKVQNCMEHLSFEKIYGI